MDSESGRREFQSWMKASLGRPTSFSPAHPVQLPPNDSQLGHIPGRPYILTDLNARTATWGNNSLEKGHVLPWCYTIGQECVTICVLFFFTPHTHTLLPWKHSRKETKDTRRRQVQPSCDLVDCNILGGKKKKSCQHNQTDMNFHWSADNIRF